MSRRASKMGKSLKNSVSPDFIYRRYGADTLRLYEMATGPLEADRPWRTGDIAGVHRFLQRLWRRIVDETTGETPDVSEDGAGWTRARSAAAPDDHGGPRRFAALRFNTAIARLIELTAYAARLPRVPRALAEPLILMVAPLAPHIAEELWQRLGHSGTVTYEPFPPPDPALAAADTVTLPVQVNGKVRFLLEVPSQATQPDIADLLASHPDYPRQAAARVVIVPGKIVNVVLQ